MVNIPPTKLAHFKQALQDENMRLTIQRRAILADVLGSDQHREIDEIYLSLKDAGIPISRARAIARWKYCSAVTGSPRVR